MARKAPSPPQPCRCELLQQALEGACGPALSIEHLLDRLTPPPAECGSDVARQNPTKEGTSR